MMTNPVTLPLSDYRAQHVRLTVDGKVATLTLNRPDKKNPLTFESYAEIANIFRAAAKDKQVKAFVVTGEGGNFCSGGDVFEIIGPLVEMDTVDLLDFTRMTGEAVKAMRQCPQPIVAAIDGVCAGAGAILAMASDIRFGTAKAKVAFLFNRVGLAGCDMGACATASASIACSTDIAHSISSMRLVMALANVGPSASSFASLVASASTASGAQSRLKKPQRSASSPPMLRPM